MAGFGRGPFGKGPFGRSDVGFDLVIDRFPSEYLGEGLPEGTDVKNNDQDPLLKVLKTYAYAVNKRRVDIDNMATLIDYERAPLEIVRLLGAMFGLGIDKNDPEFLQRSFLGNASQWLQLKASKRGYQVRGLASGFTVSVENFWRIDESYLPYIPARHLFFLKPTGADPSAPTILHTDSPPGSYPFTPTEEDETYAKSSYVRVVFEVAEPRKVTVDYNKLLDLVIDKIKDVVGIHHELTAPQFLVRMNVAVPITVSMLAQEHLQDYQHNVFSRYDIVAGDVIPCDFDEPIVEILDASFSLIAMYASAMANVVLAVDSFLSTSITNTVTATIPEDDDGDVMNVQGIQGLSMEQLDEAASMIANTTISILYQTSQLLDMMVSVSTSLGVPIDEESNFMVVAGAAAQLSLSQDTEYSIDVLESAIVQSIGEFVSDIAVNVGMSLSLTPNETSNLVTSLLLSLSMTGNEETANIAIPVGAGLTIGVINEFLSATINQPPGVSLQLEEDSPAQAVEFFSFDDSPADLFNPDSNGVVGMTIIVGP